MAKSTKKHQRQQAQNTASLTKATGLDLDKTLKGLTDTGLTVQSSFSKIQEQLINKFSELQAVEESIKLKKQEMEALHGVDATLMSLDDAKALHQQELEKMEKERETLKQHHTELKVQLETQRQREEEQYKYALAQKRKEDTDTWTEHVRVRQLEERNRTDTFERDLNARHALLTQKEETYNKAITRFEGLDAEIKKEVDTAVAIERNRLTKDFTHEKQLMEIRHASETDKVKNDNARFTAQNAALEKQVAELQAQLKDAYLKNTELAAKAVDGAAKTAGQAEALSLMTNIGGNGTRPARS